MQLAPIAAVFLKFDADPHTEMVRNKARELKIPVIFTDASFAGTNGKKFSRQEFLGELTV